MNKGPSGETTTKTEPWKAQTGPLKYGFGEARNLYNLGPQQYYPGSTVAPFAPEQVGAMEAQAARAINGSPVTQAAQQNATDTLNGNYLSAGNPYFSQMADTITGKVAAGVNSQFSQAGRYGSGAHAGVLTDEMMKGIGGLAYQNYGDERTNQLRTQAFAPGIAAQDYQDIAALGQVGAQRQGQMQNEIGDQVNRFNFEQGAPADALAQYMSFIQGNYGNTQSQPYFSNTGASILGGASTGAGLASTLGGVFGGPAGMAGGAALGGLLGGLF